MKVPRPVVKWPGGKGRVLPRVVSRLPDRIGTYYEPMLGGGAVFIELARQGRIGRAVLNDRSPELMNMWRVLKGAVDELIGELRSGRYVYDRCAYLRIRGEDPDSMEPVPRAARFVYLNRTCFNGLYRVNRQGKFNVPFGRYKDPVVCDEPNLRAVSGLLSSATLLCTDFDEAVQEAVDSGSPGDAVYFDPPYIPLSDTSNFTAYTEEGFSLDDHRRIAETMRRLAARGVRSVVSNSSARESIAVFGSFDVDYVSGSRSVGGPAEYRKPVREIVAWAGERTSAACP